MQIQKCITSKPGLFENKTLVFNDHVSIVYGKNDSGKSLIARAIMDTLSWEGHDRTAMVPMITG